VIIITNNIKIYRVIKGVNQSEMAKDIGITQQTLSSIENGASTNLKTAKKIADYFGKSIDEIFFNKEPYFK
jgi:putative transcriptional regulator